MLSWHQYTQQFFPRNRRRFVGSRTSALICGLRCRLRGRKARKRLAVECLVRTGEQPSLHQVQQHQLQHRHVHRSGFIWRGGPQGDVRGTHLLAQRRQGAHQSRSACVALRQATEGHIDIFLTARMVPQEAAKGHQHLGGYVPARWRHSIFGGHIHIFRTRSYGMTLHQDISLLKVISPSPTPSEDTHHIINSKI